GGGEHVTFYDHPVESDDLYHCWGGDQGSRHVVSIEAMPMNCIVAVRRPPAVVISVARLASKQRSRKPGAFSRKDRPVPPRLRTPPAAPHPEYDSARPPERDSARSPERGSARSPEHGSARSPEHDSVARQFACAAKRAPN